MYKRIQLHAFQRLLESHLQSVEKQCDINTLVWGLVGGAMKKVAGKSSSTAAAAAGTEGGVAGEGGADVPGGEAGGVETDIEGLRVDQYLLPAAPPATPSSGVPPLLPPPARSLFCSSMTPWSIRSMTFFITLACLQGCTLAVLRPLLCGKGSLVTVFWA